MGVVTRSVEQERWVTARGLADHFSCSVTTIRRRTVDGMPSIQVGKGSTRGRRYSIERCEQWLEQQSAA